MDSWVSANTHNDAIGVTFSFDVTHVPIPAALWLFGSGLLGLIGIARRSKTA
jgi:hypothetical protein